MIFSLHSLPGGCRDGRAGSDGSALASSMPPRLSEGDFAGALALATLVVREAEEVSMGRCGRPACTRWAACSSAWATPSVGAREHLRVGTRVAAAAAMIGRSRTFGSHWWRRGAGVTHYEEAEAIARVAGVAIARLAEPGACRRVSPMREGATLLAEGRGLEALRAYEIALAPTKTSAGRTTRWLPDTGQRRDGRASARADCNGAYPSRPAVDI